MLPSPLLPYSAALPFLPLCHSCHCRTPCPTSPQRLQLVLTTPDAIPLTATPVNVQGIQSANGMRMRANTSRRRRAGARDTHGGRSTPGSKEEKVFETRQKCLQKLAVLIVFLGTQTARKKSIVQVPQPARIRHDSRAHTHSRAHSATAAGPPMIEHREGHPAPPGAGTASRLPCGHGTW